MHVSSVLTGEDEGHVQDVCFRAYASCELLACCIKLTFMFIVLSKLLAYHSSIVSTSKKNA